MSNSVTTGFDKRKVTIGRMKKYTPLYILMAFPLLHLIILKIVPMFGVLMAFQRYSPTKGIFGSPWVGLDNFESFFTSSYFLDIVGNTIAISVLGLVFSFPISILFALMLNEIRIVKFKKAVQMITYAPHFISVVVVVGIMQQLFDPMAGVLQFFVGKEEAQQILLMSDPNWFRPLYVISGIWQSIGWSSILYTSSLASVDPGLYDAAKVDGATILQKIRHIDLPCIVPVIAISLIMAVGGIMNVGFDKAYLMQTGTNIEVSEIISTFVYKRGLLNADFGYSTAVGLFNSVVNLGLILIANFTVKKLTQESMF